MQAKTKNRLSVVIGFVVALVYVFVPTDVLPDAMPVVGWIDDIVAVLLAVANAIRIGKKMQ